MISSSAVNMGYVLTELGMKSQSGLGDAVYVYPIVKHFSPKFDHIYLMNNYPEIFESIKNVSCHRHLKLNYIAIPEGDNVRKIPVNIRCTAGAGKYKQGTSQFEDILAFSGIGQKLDFKLDWSIHNPELINTIKLVAKGRPVCVVAAPYEPFGRDDGIGADMRINPKSIQRILDKFRKEILFITTGNRYCLHKLTAEHDLVDQTSVSDLIDIVSISDMTLGQVGHMLPISESLGKKNFLVFAEKSFNSKEKFIRAITPEKVVHYKHLNTSVKDTDDNIINKFRTFTGETNV